jgi:hypothetical protein
MRSSLSLGVTLLLVLGLASEASAHMPNIATFTLAEGDDDWRLNVHMSTDGMHQVMQRLHPGEQLSSLEPKVYQSYVVAALRDGIAFAYDGAPVVIGEAQVALAAHQSMVSFVVPRPPAGAAVINVHIDALSQRGDQNNVFRLDTAGSKAHVVLKSESAFRGDLALAAGNKNEFAAGTTGASTSNEATKRSAERWPALLVLSLIAVSITGAASVKGRSWLRKRGREGTTPTIV